MYSAQVLDHFQNPRNVGELAGANASAQLENPVCGDVLQLTMRVVDGRIAEARFRARGCVPSIACGSMLTELVTNHSVAEAQALGREELVANLGGLPAASGHAAQLAIDALRAALKAFSS
jgi:nitrogen fixation NifU-like protein